MAARRISAGLRWQVRAAESGVTDAACPGQSGTVGITSGGREFDNVNRNDAPAARTAWFTLNDHIELESHPPAAPVRTDASPTRKKHKYGHGAHVHPGTVVRRRRRPTGLLHFRDRVWHLPGDGPESLAVFSTAGIVRVLPGKPGGARREEALTP